MGRRGSRPQHYHALATMDSVMEQTGCVRKYGGDMALAKHAGMDIIGHRQVAMVIHCRRCCCNSR